MKKLFSVYLDWFNKGNKVLHLLITIIGLAIIIPMLIILLFINIIAFLHNNNSDSKWIKYLKLALRLVTFVLFFACCLANEIVKNSVILNSYNVKLMFYTAIIYFFLVIPYFSCKVFRIYDSFKVAWVEQALILLLFIVFFKHYLLLRNDNPAESDYLDIISWMCTFAGIVASIKL